MMLKKAEEESGARANIYVFWGRQKVRKSASIGAELGQRKRRKFGRMIEPRGK